MIEKLVWSLMDVLKAEGYVPTVNDEVIRFEDLRPTSNGIWAQLRNGDCVAVHTPDEIIWRKAVPS